MKRAAFLIAVILGATVVAQAQTTIYWRRDTIYAGPGGGAIATITPPPSDTAAPTAPSSLSATSATATSVTLSWTGSTDSGGSSLAGYKIYRQKGSGANLPVGTVSAPGFVDQPLEPSTGYTYTIIAFDHAQNHSSASNSINPTTSVWTGESTPPSAPTNLRGIPTTRQWTYKVRLDWAAATDAGGSGVAGYKVYRNDTLISGGSPITNRYYEDSTNTANTAFTYKVKAVDGAGNESGYSNTAAVTTLRTLIVSDDFNRADEYCPPSGYSSDFCVLANTLQIMPDHFAVGGAYVDWDTGASVGTYLGSVSILSRNPDTYSGLVFWSSGTSLYRVGISDNWAAQRIYLTYEASEDGDSWVSSSNLPPGPGKLTIDANSSTRRIKIFWNGVLQLDVTDTNTTRPNSGEVTLFDWGGGYAVFDDLLLEQ